jgi:thiol:disulfide interchange protein DsbD
MNYAEKRTVKKSLATYWLQFILRTVTGSLRHHYRSVVQTSKLDCMKFTLSAFIFLFPGAAFAEDTVIELNNMPPPQVTIIYPDTPTVAGTQVTVEVIIPTRWHVNANVAADEFLKPSTLEIAAKGITFDNPLWPPALKEYSEALGLDNLIFKDTLRILVPVKNILPNYDTTTTNATFHYQACSNFICLAPNEVRATLENLTFEKQQGKSLLPAKKKSTEPLAILLLFAFLGGLILNLMPCVLPVLSLKLFSLIKQAREARRRLLALGIALTAGVLVSFWSLAGIIVIIRAGGGNPGWGMQFQSIGFIAFMVAILFAFATSLFGAFEVWLPGRSLTKMDKATHKEGLPGAFFTGILLVLLSTPCSAPFLGTAMGFAFAAPTRTLFLFFTVAAFGLAFPYLLVSLFPKALKVFPKPGAWMNHLQKVLGLLLLGTAAWLLWIVYGIAGETGMAFISLLGISCGVSGAILGRLAPPHKPFYREILVAGILIAANVCLWLFAVEPRIDTALNEKRQQTETQALDENGWYHYSPELMKDFAATGRPVFLDVTADWCLTCKANETAVLSRDTVKRLFKEHNIAKVKADWTLQNEDISQLLRQLGRSGVPVYAVFPVNQFDVPVVLPEILTVDAIREALR